MRADCQWNKSCDLNLFHFYLTYKHTSSFSVPTHRHTHTAALTLNCTQVLRSAAKFAPGHRVERPASGTVQGPKQLQTRKPSRNPPGCSFCEKLTETWAAVDGLIRLAGLCLDSLCEQWRLRSSSRFFPRSQRRAKGGMGECRHRPPRSASTTLTPPSSSNSFCNHT